MAVVRAGYADVTLEAGSRIGGWLGPPKEREHLVSVQAGYYRYEYQ